MCMHVCLHACVRVRVCMCVHIYMPMLVGVYENLDIGELVRGWRRVSLGAGVTSVSWAQLVTC